MGKYMRKCKGVGEVAVMEVAQVGVKTRARALAMEEEEANTGTAKKMKVDGSGELNFSSSVVELTSPRRAVVTPENLVSPATSCASTTCSDQVPTSCCSSNASTEITKKIIDLEEEDEIENLTYDFGGGRERRETTPSSELQAESGELESSAAKPSSEANSRSRSKTSEKMPSEAELEDFFASAEKNLQKRFTDKYNFDVVKEIPLEGRYEWICLKP